MNSKQNQQLTRRNFLSSAAASAALFSFIPGRILGADGEPSANNKLNIAGIGVGGMGLGNIREVAGTENIVALCDVDWGYAAHTFKEYSKTTAKCWIRWARISTR
jgi:hypothetical protein